MYKFCPNCGEKLTNVTEKGFTCEKCHKKVYFNSKPTSAIVPIYGKEALISTRAVEPYKGCIDTIGGFLENGEDPLVGAAREFLEETGKEIDPSDLEFLGITISDYPFEGDVNNVLNIIYTIKFDSKLVLDPKDDVAELIWVNIEGSQEGFKHILHTEKVFKLLKEKYL